MNINLNNPISHRIYKVMCLRLITNTFSTLDYQFQKLTIFLFIFGGGMEKNHTYAKVYSWHLSLGSVGVGWLYDIQEIEPGSLGIM